MKTKQNRSKKMFYSYIRVILNKKLFISSLIFLNCCLYNIQSKADVIHYEHILNAQYGFLLDNQNLCTGSQIWLSFETGYFPLESAYPASSFRLHWILLNSTSGLTEDFYSSTTAFPTPYTLGAIGSYTLTINIENNLTGPWLLFSSGPGSCHFNVVGPVATNFSLSPDHICDSIGISVGTITNFTQGAVYGWSSSSNDINFTSPNAVTTSINIGNYGTFQICLSGSNACGYVSSCQTLTAAHRPDITSILIDNHNSPCCPVLTTSGGLPPYNYLWSGPLAYISAVKDPCGIGGTPMVENGTYSVTVTDAYGCSVTGSIVRNCNTCNSQCHYWAVGGNYVNNGGAVDQTNNTENILGINDAATCPSCTFFPTNTSPLRVFTNSSEKMRITYDGKIGIGTISPIRMLSVNSGLNIDQSNSDLGNSDGTGNALLHGLGFGSSNGTTSEGIGSSRSNNSLNPFGLDFYTNYRKRMVVSYDGNVGIGKSSGLDYKLNILSNDVPSKGGISSIVSTNSTSDSKIAVRGEIIDPVNGVGMIHTAGYFKATSNKKSFSSPFPPYPKFYTPGTNWSGYFQGDVNIAGETWIMGQHIGSDSVLKTNIDSVSNALTIINQLHPKTYDFRINDFPYLNLPLERQIGFVAQDVKGVLPDLVDSVKYNEVKDTSGNILYAGGTYLSLNYIGIIPVAIAGIRELNSKVNNLSSSSIRPSCQLISNYLLKTTGADSVCNSQLYDNGSCVGIGTSTLPSGYKLVVDGKLGARDIIVACPPSWPDYVFSDTYTLPALDEVENYVTTNQHLPGIPAANEIQQGGINVGNMQTQQMEKIEELYLYMIEMNKQLKQLRAENEALKARMKTIEVK